MTPVPPWLHWLESCSSTNAWAIAQAPHLRHGDIVFTRQQTAGRGQHGRPWYAPPGVLTASLIGGGESRSGSNYPLSTAHLTGLSLAAGLAVIYAVEDLVPQLQGQLRIKWANDIWLQSPALDGHAGSWGQLPCPNPRPYRKLAGILCEAFAPASSSQTRVVIGVGLNRCVDFAAAGLDPDQIGYPISLHQVCDSVPDEIALLTQLRHYLLQTLDILGAERAIAVSGLAAFLPELQRRDGLLDRTITLQLADRQISGRAAGMNSDGQLLLQSADGIQSFSAGRVIRWQ